MNWNDQVREIVLAGALIIAAFTTGCGARSDLKAIKGHVKFKNGEAIKRGTIEYAGTDSTGTQSGARIADGDYEIPQDKGLRSGKYIVRIYAPASLLAPQGAPGAAGMHPGVSGKQGLQLPEERVSPEFNSQSKLTAEVGNEATQTFDFEVE